MAGFLAVPADGRATTGTGTPADVEGDAVSDVGRGASGPVGELSTVSASSLGSGPGLRYQPALDGLRGLAVGVVWLYHLERLDGGFLGVDLFFVLSGFLITSLLVVEHRARGSVDLVRFWGRRARRLLPGLMVLLTGTSLLHVFLTPLEQRRAFRGEALATLGYVVNWHDMTVDAGFVPRVVPHTWSLAIEGQFYLAWSLVAVLVLGAAHQLRRRHAGASPGGSYQHLGRWRRGVDMAPEAWVRRLGWWALGGAAISFGLLGWMYSSSSFSRLHRAYFGTDTRLGAVLLGAALAAFVGCRRPLAAGVPGAVVAEARGSVAGGLSGSVAEGSGSAAELRGSAAYEVQGSVVADGSGVSIGDDLPMGRVLHVRRRDAVVWGRELAGWAALAWMAWSVVTVAVVDRWYYRGGLLVFALAAVVVIWAVTARATGPLARLLSLPPLRWLGLVSYGVYLWHWPIKTFVSFDRFHVDRWALDALRIVCTLAVATVSYLLVEQPIRRGALRGRALYLATAGGVTVTVVAVLAATAGAS